MTRSMTRSTILTSAVVLVSVTVGAAAALAQSAPEGENGRYTLSPIADGMIRLDTRTGAVSTCNNGGTGWACYVVPDERAAYDQEIGRLQAENEKSKSEIEKSKEEIEKLKTELASRAPVEGKTDETLPKSDSLKKAEPKVAEVPRKIEIPLPSDRDMDRLMSFLEQAWRRLVEMANRMQKDVGGKI